MAIVGAIAITIVLGYIALFFLGMAIPPLIGFDEFHIPAGLLLLVVAFIPCVVWWFLVGSHISVSINLN